MSKKCVQFAVSYTIYVDYSFIYGIYFYTSIWLIYLWYSYTQRRIQGGAKYEYEYQNSLKTRLKNIKITLKVEFIKINLARKFTETQIFFRTGRILPPPPGKILYPPLVALLMSTKSVQFHNVIHFLVTFSLTRRKKGPLFLPPLYSLGRVGCFTAVLDWSRRRKIYFCI